MNELHPTAPKLLTEADAAAYLGLSPATLSRWRWQGDRGPAWVRFSGRAVRYRLAELDAFIERAEVRP